MNLDLDRITHPLRLAAGSHQRGSGKGCAMNVISYIMGDIEITDYPACSAMPLARLVQKLNDRMGVGADKYLSPEDSVVVLDLAWQTVGTADAPFSVLTRWLADLLVDPDWGILQYVYDPKIADIIRRTATLRIQSKRLPLQQWRAAEKSLLRWLDLFELVEAVRFTDSVAAADCAAAIHARKAVQRHADEIAARTGFTRWAIARWRQLAGLDAAGDIDAGAVDSALAQWELP